MVDYTSKPTGSGGGGVGLFIAGAAVVVVLLYALFAGGGSTTIDPAALADEPAPAEAAPLVTE